MPHVEQSHRGRWHLGDPLPLSPRAAAGLVAVLAILILLLLMAKDAKGNFVYWANGPPVDSVGRAKLNGTGANNSFISGLSVAHGVAVDSKYIYWTEGDGSASAIGRANLDGSGVNRNFIPNSAGLGFSPMPQAAIAVTSSAIYWHNSSTATIGRANIDGTAPNPGLINTGASAVCGIAADQSFVYWLDTGLAARIGRAAADGSNPSLQFISGVSGSCGLAVDPSFLYWGATNQSIGRAPVGGGTADNGFVSGATSAPNSPCGVAVNSQYVFWASSGTGVSIGRANIGGGAPNPNRVSGLDVPCLPAAAPSNKVTINSITRKKRKGTAIINAKVPGPGQITLTNTGTEDVNAVAAAVKQVGLTITGPSSFKLAVKPVGKTKKKLKKQLKRKRKAKVAVRAFVTFVPAGVAGVPNAQPVKTKLIKQRKRKR